MINKEMTNQIELIYDTPKELGESIIDFLLNDEMKELYEINSVALFIVTEKGMYSCVKNLDVITACDIMHNLKIQIDDAIAKEAIKGE